MKSKLILNTLRSVKNTKSRFIAIMAIIAIGCGFFAGVKSACPDMKTSAAQYLNEQGLADFHIMSDLGFDNEDVSAVNNAVSADEIYAGYSAELMLTDGNKNERIVKAYSYDPDSGINLPYVTEGRLPEDPNEVFIDERFFSAATPETGDEITLKTGDDSELSDVLKRSTYTVVGKGISPVYLSFDRGSASIGNGTVNGWLLIPEENFSYEVYTDMYISLSETKGMDPYSDEYENIISNNTDVLESFADVQIEHRRSAVINEAYEDINKAKDEVSDGEKEIAENEAKLAEAQKEIDDGEKEIADNEVKLAEAQKEINDGQEKLANGESDYNNGLSAVNAINSEAELLNVVLKNYQTDAVQSREPIDEIIANINQNDFLAADETLEQLLTAYMTIPAAYDDGTKSMAEQGIRQYIAGLTEQAQELESTLAESRIQLDNAAAELENARAGLAEGREEIDKAKAEISDGKQEIEDAKKEIADGKDDIEDAKREIADAEKEVREKTDDVKWYVFDREFNPSYSNYPEDCERVDAIANVFPIFFILVAALVCCTTMTRMVEEQRTQTGTLKALGYSRFSIIFQYILYALAASIPGGIIGLIVGFNTIPTIIFKCYQAMYSLPYLIAPFRWNYAAGCVIAACLCTGLSALYASRLELVSCPAQLMRPKPPKNGKRIFLERISFIWTRLKFTTKVTFRNLFRYKARLLMTVVGIAGCTALLLTGYGLQYSITSIVDKQYVDIFRYGALVALDKNADSEAYDSVLEDCSADGLISDKMLVMQETVDIKSSDKILETYILVPEDPASLDKFISLHERRSKEKIVLGGGVVLSEKLARLLGVKAGDSVYFDDNTPVRVDAICENYTFNYAYMSPEVYEKSGFDDDLRNNMILLNLTDSSQETEDKLSSRLVKNGTVLAVSFSSHGGDKFRDLVSSLSMVIVVIIVAAGALAFVVLFNLSNININERIHELATIKVLGFYDGEVAAYVYRENILLTLMGTVVGLGLGVALEKFVIKTAEVDSVMFYPGIPFLCFAKAAALTLLFALTVNVTLYFRLKKIDMASSLKAVE